jgi:hypothetical protein
MLSSFKRLQKSDGNPNWMNPNNVSGYFSTASTESRLLNIPADPFNVDLRTHTAQTMTGGKRGKTRKKTKRRNKTRRRR